MPNLRRYWFPKLGGKRQCMKCGFLTGLDVWVEPETSEEQSASGIQLVQQVRNYLATHDKSPEGETYFLRCHRGVWTDSKVYAGSQDTVTSAKALRGCTFFFPYQQGIPPEAHLELKKDASNRWWTFWAVLGAIGVGGTVSGVILFLLS